MTQTYQSNYKSYLTQSLSASGTTAYLQTVPTVTEGRLLLSNGNIKEWVSFAGVSGSAVTLTGRNLSQTADPATAGTGLEWGAGTQVILVAMHDQLTDKQEDTAFTGSVSATDVTFTNTTTGGLKVKSLTTTQRDALSSPGNGTIIYNSTAGEFQIRQGGAWSTMASGSTQPNASTTVAGKKEDPTDAESIAGTDVGGTGATMSPTCSQVAKNIQSGTFVYGTDVGGDDTYVVALTPAMTTNTNGSRFTFTPTTTNTGACTVDPGGGALNIKTKDGNDPQSGVIRAGKPVTGTILSGQYILDNEDFATTANKGVAQLATDSIAETGSNTTDTITASQLDKYAVSTSLRGDWYTTILRWYKSSTNSFASWSSGFGSGATSNEMYAYIIWNTAGVADSYTQIIGSGSSNEFSPSAGKDIRIKWRMKYQDTTDRKGFGLCLSGSSNTISTAQTDITNGLVRFVLNGSTLYAHNSNGTTATSTDVTSGVTVTNWNTYEIVFNPGTDIKFYINGTLKATHTTNLPTTGTQTLAIGVNANNRETYISNINVSIES